MEQKELLSINKYTKILTPAMAYNIESDSRILIPFTSGEKIDIIPYTDDIPSFIVNSLSPAEILAIDINEDENIATIVVPDDKFALAIGARGQNVKLAAILTGWKIDIKTKTEIENKIIE